MKHKYVCEYCGKDDFLTREECEKHEKEHKIEEMKSKFPGAIICPSCEGEGGYWGNGGANWRDCHVCGGKGIVIPHEKIETSITYEKI